MVEFVAFDDDIEVKGGVILSVMTGVDYFSDVPLKILEENGIKSPEVNGWYHQQKWLDAFKILSERLGERALYSVGMKIPENADWPSNVAGIKDALASIDVAYHMNHRKDGEILLDMKTGEKKEGIGNYEFVDLGENKIKIICKNPYPCSFDMGLIESVFNIFSPEGSDVKISHEDESCRKKEGNSCVYVVEW